MADNSSPHPMALALGYGIAALLAVAGLLSVRQRELSPLDVFLPTWVGINLVLVHLPIKHQGGLPRRFMWPSPYWPRPGYATGSCPSSVAPVCFAGHPATALILNSRCATFLLYSPPPPALWSPFWVEDPSHGALFSLLFA